MPRPAIVKAMRFALKIAKTDYERHPGNALADVIAYLTVKIGKRQRPQYHQLPMFAVVGAPSGKYRCVGCGKRFGENTVSRLQAKRAYLTLHCPHCLVSWFADQSQ